MSNILNITRINIIYLWIVFGFKATFFSYFRQHSKCFSSVLKFMPVHTSQVLYSIQFEFSHELLKPAYEMMWSGEWPNYTVICS